MSFNNTNIIFLEDGDFINKKLSYKGKPTSGKWLVMVQSSYCGYCTKVKPDLIKFAQKYKNITCATLQTDGSPKEQALAKKLPEIVGTEIQGVPCYLVFDNGVFVTMSSGAQTEKELVEFMS